ncbi:conserved protein of unknown function [Acetoanaerobium sticklandii]|uniref:Uncharacterized protein n=1 Tax=Acetoanaerobium sticklandii (strain ATCC 12662 / DSM 519 / JCM 1433 / CCUG 9281 / NCIMB 10654 / HF) TaxID=499177 RepID=E3PRP4_ACESD|nr:conserved protein of unknown function [Acetoanaerobium sticklandii]
MLFKEKITNIHATKNPKARPLRINEIEYANLMCKSS